MIDVFMQILLIVVVAGFPILAIVANFMRHRMEASIEQQGLAADHAVEDGLYPLVLPYRATSADESKRAA